MQLNSQYLSIRGCNFTLNFPSSLPKPGLLRCIISTNLIISCLWKTTAAQEDAFTSLLTVIEPYLWLGFLDFLVLDLSGGSSLSHLSYE